MNLVVKITSTESASEGTGLVALAHQPLGDAFFAKVVPALTTPERFPQNLKTYSAPEINYCILKSIAFIMLLLISYLFCLLI